jgi:hypothetical protein
MIAHDVGADPMLRHALILGGAALVTGIFYAMDAWWNRPSRRRARARKWAEPEPAQSAAHLYLQDALRADRIRSAAFTSTQSGAMACILIFMAVDDPAWLVWTLLAMSPVLFTGLLMVGLDHRDAPADYLRARLWPTSKVGQVLRPGDALPAGGLRL